MSLRRTPSLNSHISSNCLVASLVHVFCCTATSRCRQVEIRSSCTRRLHVTVRLSSLSTANMLERSMPRTFRSTLDLTSLLRSALFKKLTQPKDLVEVHLAFVRARARAHAPRLRLHASCSFFGNARSEKSLRSAVLCKQNCRKTRVAQSTEKSRNPARALKTLLQPILPRRPDGTVNLRPPADDHLSR